MPSSRGGTWPQDPRRAGQEASCACTTLGLGNSPLLAAQGLNTTRQLTIKHKEKTSQQPVWIKEINACKNALSPRKKGDAKHEASFPRLGSPSDGSEPHNGDGGGGNKVHRSGHPVRKGVDTSTRTQGDGLADIMQPTRQREASSSAACATSPASGLRVAWVVPRGSESGQGPAGLGPGPPQWTGVAAPPVG